MIKRKGVSERRFVGFKCDDDLYLALKNRADSEQRTVSNMLSVLISHGVTTSFENGACSCLKDKKPS